MDDFRHGIERGIRLAKTHLDDAEASLRAEQRRGTAAGAAIENTGQTRHEWAPDYDSPISREGVASWAGRDLRAEGQAVRELTPDEIRADELKGIAERLQFLDRHAAASGPSVLVFDLNAIIDGRIKALLPEQTSSDEALLDMERQLRAKMDAVVGRSPQLSDEDRRARAINDLMTGKTTVNKVRAEEGLRYNQLDSDGIDVTRESPWRHDGAALRLTVDYQPNASVTGEYRIPPYQVDQLKTIADGRPSWPDTSVPEPVVREEAGTDLRERLAGMTETLMGAMGKSDKVHAIEAGLQLLALDEGQPEASGLSRDARSRLSGELAAAIASFL